MKIETGNGTTQAQPGQLGSSQPMNGFAHTDEQIDKAKEKIVVDSDK
jgi:hypothetical protein